MLKAMFYDVGGVFHVPVYDEAMKADYAARVHSFLLSHGIDTGLSPAETERLIAKGTAAYKRAGEQSGVELPSLRIWKDFVFKDYNIPEETLAPIAVTLSDMHNARRKRQVRPHLLEMVQGVQALGLRQGVISNVISEHFIPDCVEEYGLAPYMECIVQSSIEGVRKPRAALFTRAADKLGVKPEECAYLGDTISRDIIGAKNAGMKLMIQIINPNGTKQDADFDPNAYRPDFVITDPLEVPEILKAHLND
jgi:putative hydrolase of the HAD superfamily